MTVENLVDLDGTNINDVLNVDPQTETIPEDLQEIVTDGTIDDQQYEGYMGNVSKLPLSNDAEV